MQAFKGKKSILAWVAMGVVFFAAMPPSAEAARVLLKEDGMTCLDEIWDGAERVLDATALSSTPTYLNADGSEGGDGRPATKYTFSVNSTYKGSDLKAGDTFSVYIFGWNKAPEGVRYRISQVGEGYAPNVRYILALGKPSRAGFVNPVGLNRGKFRVRQDDSGLLMVQNGVKNRGLLDCTNPNGLASGLASRVKTLQGAGDAVGAIDLDTFSLLLRAKAGN